MTSSIDFQRSDEQPWTNAAKTAREYVVELRNSGMGCNCDLDNWQPEPITGHSCVCRIHKAALAKVRECRS